MNVKIQYCDFPQGSIRPVSSKSISNRALIIHALTGNVCELENLSESEDTFTLIELLRALENQTSRVDLNVGAAGTVMRFLISYCCVSQKHVMLTGNSRMLDRPVGELVAALRGIGARINYLGNEGFPPLEIIPSAITGGKMKLNASVSSQFITSLLLCAPYFENGLEISLEGKSVSGSYIDLTIDTMEKFGVMVERNANTLTVKNQQYIPRKFAIEGDWSSASYFYSLASLSKRAKIELLGMNMHSQQGDIAIMEIAQVVGVETSQTPNGILIEKRAAIIPDKFEYDFNLCPDIVQTVVPMLAGNGVAYAKLKGLETLIIKETNRIAALKNEMHKFGIEFLPAGAAEISFESKGLVAYNGLVATYDDHRMAMGFAPMVQKTGKLIIENKDTVKKSYIRFWDDLKTLGCIVENYDI